MWLQKRGNSLPHPPPTGRPARLAARFQGYAPRFSRLHVILRKLQGYAPDRLKHSSQPDPYCQTCYSVFFCLPLPKSPTDWEPGPSGGHQIPAPFQCLQNYILKAISSVLIPLLLGFPISFSYADLPTNYFFLGISSFFL